MIDRRSHVAGNIYTEKKNGINVHLYGAQAEYRELYKRAELGRKYEKQLQDDVVWLCLSVGLGVEEPVLRTLMGKADTDELMKLKEALDCRLAEMMPVRSQLLMNNEQPDFVESGYLI